MRAVYRCPTPQAEEVIQALIASSGELELTAWDCEDPTLTTVLGPTRPQMLLVGAMLDHNIELISLENDNPNAQEAHPSITLRAQVCAQCDVVIAHCERISHAFKTWQAAVSAGTPDELTHEIGARSAQMMEMLKKVRDESGQLTTDDDWMTPIYEHARHLFPIFEVVLSDSDEQSN